MLLHFAFAGVASHSIHRTLLFVEERPTGCRGTASQPNTSPIPAGVSNHQAKRYGNTENRTNRGGSTLGLLATLRLALSIPWAYGQTGIRLSAVRAF